MTIVFVESPTKARTLSRFLGKDYRIEATFGHLRDLPKSELGVEVEQNFSPKYVIPRDKAKRVKELKAMAKGGGKIILATDPDREGEAIAWHLTQVLNAGNQSRRQTQDKKSKNLANQDLAPRDKNQNEAGKNFLFQRISFHEITEEAIREALTHPGEINVQLVNAQQARRVLDRLVGYKLSPMLWKKLSRRWLSAGRVQSVSVRLIVEREREIDQFKKEEFWVIEGKFSSGHPEQSEGSSVSVKNSGDASLDFSGRTPRIDNNIIAKLISKNGVKYEQSRTIKLFDGSYTYTKTSIANKETADQIVTDLKSPFTVSTVDKKEVKRSPPPPYTTATLQIDAGRRLGYTSKRTMQIAQQLYEDGLITYHRTDSVNLATRFLGTAKRYIEEAFGAKYSHYRTYATKSKLAQEAHEAIRPTDLRIKNEELRMKNGLRSEHEKLYELIWKRAVASQMEAAIFDSTTIDINSANGYQFETQGSVIKFDGFLKVVGYDTETVVLPDIIVGETIQLVNTLPTRKFTTPPPRYSEASLIKALEEDGIGRPSTYAPTISTIQERLYVEKETKEDGRKGRNFIPTELGFLVNDFLVKYFPNIVDLKFTAEMEEGLDEIAEGTREWVPFIAEFYTPFNERLVEVEENVIKVEVPIEKTGNKCPDCQQGKEIIKQGRYGKFLACSRFPDCKYTKNLLEKIDMKCLDCKEGDIVVRKTRRGRIFYGCSRYPECKFASWSKPIISKTADSQNSEAAK